MKQVLLLGATSGIAKALAYELADKGIDLVLAARNMNELKAISNDLILRYGISVHPIYFDAYDYQSANEFCAEISNIAPAMDGMILCYGYLGDQQTGETDFEEAKRIIDLNYTSAVVYLQAFANWLKVRNQGGFLCAISSVAGDRGRQSNYLYGSSKGALSLFLQGLRNSLNKQNIQVITLKPGFVDTKMTYGMLRDSPLVSSPSLVAKLIYKTIKKRRDVAYIPGFWKLVMLTIKSIPEKVFKKLSL